MVPALPTPALSTELAVRPDPTLVLLEAWLQGRKPATATAYAKDLDDFGRWRESTTAAAIAGLLALDVGPAHLMVMAYRTSLLERGLSAATISRRLAALKSLSRLARTTGQCSWILEVGPPKPEPRRDVRGPTEPELKRLWKAATAAGDGPAARRDRAIVALLYGLGLRRGEVVALDLVDVDFAANTIAILGKGQREKIRLTLVPEVSRHVGQWVLSRGGDPGPLITRADRASSTGLERLTGEAVRRLLVRLSRRAKLPRDVRPHGLRHSAITTALESGESVSRVRKFSRHAKVETVMRYDDARRDDAGDVARSLARVLK